MAVATTSEKLKSELAVTSYDFDPGATTATEIAWVDMRDYESIMIQFFRTIGTGTISMTLLGNTASDGSGTDVTIKADPSKAADATGDYFFLEATAEEIGTAGANVRYVTAVCTFGTGTDEGVVTYIRKGRKRYSGMTSDYIS